MKILVTGGAGFIGSNFIIYLLKKYPKYNVINVDKLSYAADLNYLKSVEDNPNYKFIKADISDRSVMEELFLNEKIEAVINFAAESHVDRSIVDSTPFVISNILGTQVLLDLSMKYNIKKYFQISTDEVYGHLGLDEERGFLETDRLHPRSPYSSSKAGADLMALSYFETHNLPVLVSRCSNNFGPHQCEEKFIPTCISSILKGEKIPIYGDGKYVRDWLHVEDHCKGIDNIFHKGEFGEIYNIATNNEWDNTSLAKKIIELMGGSEDTITFVKDRPGHDRRYSIDATKIKNELNWKAEIEFEEGLKDTIEWYKNLNKE